MSTALRTFLTSGQQSLRILVPRSNISSSTASTKQAVKTVEAETVNILRDGCKHRVNNLEKRFLVWAGKYARVEEVPPTVPQGMMEKARNKIRIKISNYMMLATAVASLAFVYSGKEAAKRGESVQKMNQEWHRRINGEAIKPTD